MDGCPCPSCIDLPTEQKQDNASHRATSFTASTRPLGGGDLVALDFIGPLPEDGGFNSILTMTNQLGADIQIVPTCTDIMAEDFAGIFFNEWYCKNGLPLDIVSDRDKLFMSKFWKALHKLTGVKLKMSTAYHPQTDDASE